MKKLKQKLVLLEIFSFVSSVLPVLVVVICNFDRYVKTGADAVKLGLAGIMALVFMLLKVVGKLRLPEHRVTTYALVFALSYLMSSVLDDLMLLSGMALLGEMIDFLFFSRPISQTREEIAAHRTAKLISSNLKVENSSESGRV